MKLAELMKKFPNAKLSENAIHFPGPPKAPKNSLTIPISDLGYNKKVGVFRKSLKPDNKNELEIT